MVDVVGSKAVGQGSAGSGSGGAPVKVAAAPAVEADGYYEVDRHDLLAVMPDVVQKSVLEVGAAGGSTLVALKRHRGARLVTGVELFELPGTDQSSPEIDRFIIGDIERMDLDLSPESFDIVVCGDVFEHLRDPWASLKYLTTFLKPGGSFVISLPNILYWRAFRHIVAGDFKYSPSGVLDRTHLRFFCKKNMTDLATSAALQVIRVEPSFRFHRQLRRDKRLNRLTLGLFERFLAQQYLLVAVKAPVA